VLLVDGELANGREGDVSHQPLNWEDVVICHVASTNGSHREVSEETRDFIVVWIHGGKRLIPLAQLVILWVPASYGFVENDGLKACPLPLLSPDAQRGHVLGPAALTVAAALKVHGDASRRHAQHVRAIISRNFFFSYF